MGRSRGKINRNGKERQRKRERKGEGKRRRQKGEKKGRGTEEENGGIARDYICHGCQTTARGKEEVMRNRECSNYRVGREGC